jgi:Ca2+-binding EF-hand superfamily protein
MGNVQTSITAPLPLSADDLQVLSYTTHYTPKEINHLRDQFYRDVGGPSLSAEDFLIGAEACGIRSEAVRYMLLNAFDADGDNFISTFEFIKATSTMTKGTDAEKLDFAFRMYDVRRCNTIFYNDALQILKGLEKSFGMFSVPGEEGLLSSAEMAERLFRGARQLCKAEFINFVRMNPSVVSGLELTKRP